MPTWRGVAAASSTSSRGHGYESCRTSFLIPVMTRTTSLTQMRISILSLEQSL